MRLLNRVVVAVSCTTVVFAQAGQGTITGTVTDPNRDPVIGQSVLMRNKATKSVYEAPLSRKGEYRVVVPAGTYELVIPDVALRYQRYEHKEEINVQGGATVRVDIVGVRHNNLGVPGDENAHHLIRDKYAGKVKGPIPRLNGKPDLSGMWFLAERVVFDEDPDPALTEWAKTVAEERRKNNRRDMPTAICLPFGPLPLRGLAARFMQSRSHLMLLVEGEPVVRQIFLDGRPHPADLNPTWMGHSVGRWDGDTLVVDTVGFNGKLWLNASGTPLTEKLHLTERYQRTSLATLLVEYVFDDPETFVTPHRAQRVWELAPGEEVMEYVCNENNRYRELVGR